MSALMARRYYTRGITELRSNELDDACQDLQAAVQLIPSYYEARIAYATALLELKDPPRAIQTCARDFTTRPVVPVERCSVGRLAMRWSLVETFWPPSKRSPNRKRSARKTVPIYTIAWLGCGHEPDASTRPSPNYSPPLVSPARPNETSADDHGRTG
jgi:hypothetical protein